MYELLAAVGPQMPADKPRYLMGVGTPTDLLRAVGNGIDLFDCVLPTRNARNGQALTWSGRVNLRQARHSVDLGPVDPMWVCPTCAAFSRGYVRHLFKSDEMLGPRLLTLHNLHFYGALMRKAREMIRAQAFASWAESTFQRMRELDEVIAADG